MGVLTASGSGSVWLTVTTSCLLRPLRLDFFWVSLVMSCESAKGEQIIHRIKRISVYYRNWSVFDRSFSVDYMYIHWTFESGNLEFYVSGIKMHSMASIKHVLIHVPDDETDSLKRR